MGLDVAQTLLSAPLHVAQTFLSAPEQTRVSALRSDGQRQAQSRHRPRPITAILQAYMPVMLRGDLAAENQPDAGAFGLRRVEGNEEIVRVADARAMVGDL